MRCRCRGTGILDHDFVAPKWVLVDGGRPGETGSVLLVQKWVHHAGAWEALLVVNQERIIGRTKLESVELPEEVTGPTSHMARTTLQGQGVEVTIYHRNTPCR